MRFAVHNFSPPGNKDVPLYDVVSYLEKQEVQIPD
jgi:hypothetical protein